MTKKGKIGLTIGIVAATIVSLAGLYGISLLFYNPYLSPNMIEYYSNDANFTWFEATIRECDNNEYGYITIQDIAVVDNKKPLEKTNYTQARIYSPDIEETWNSFNPYVGLRFEFRGTMAVFFDGCPPAIVEIFYNEQTILSFEDGKAALLEWAKTIH